MGLYTIRMLQTDRYKYVFHANDIDELYDSAIKAGRLEASEKKALLDNAWQTSLEHALSKERHQFYEILNTIKPLWQQHFGHQL